MIPLESKFIIVLHNFSIQANSVQDERVLVFTHEESVPKTTFCFSSCPLHINILPGKHPSYPFPQKTRANHAPKSNFSPANRVARRRPLSRPRQTPAQNRRKEIANRRGMQIPAGSRVRGRETRAARESGESPKPAAREHSVELPDA